MVKSLAVVVLLLLAGGVSAAGDDTQVFLRVNPLAGESKTTSSGGSRGVLGLSTTRSQNTSKTITRNMKWNCEVRYRGKRRPEKLEVKAWYIGYEGTDTKPKVLGKDTKVLKLDEAGKASVEIESPTVRLSKSRTSSGSTGGHAGHIAKTKSTVRGQRMAGCVVQLWEDGKLVKSYASMSQWDRAAKDENFSEATLNRKEKNRLN